MTTYEKLTVANFGLNVVILLVLSVALVPHMKQGMVVVRDAVLWIAMVALLLMMVWAAWFRFVGQEPISAEEAERDELIDWAGTASVTTAPQDAQWN